MALFAKIVTQNPMRKAAAAEMEAGKSVNHGHKVEYSTDDDMIAKKNGQVPVFAQPLGRVVAQCTDAKEIPQLFKLKEGTELPYPTAESPTKLPVGAPLDEADFLIAANRGAVAVASADLLKEANKQKQALQGGPKSKGRGPVDAGSVKLS